LLLRSSAQGAPGIDVVNWRQPVLAGDALRAELQVLDKRASKSRPGIGFVQVRATLTNQRGEVVLEMENAIMFAARGAGA
jgi:acyl dehydratase